MSRIGKEEFLSRLFDALGPIGSMEEGVVKTSNARIEAVNNKIKLSIRMAFGFRNIDNMIDMIMLRCSDLEVPLPWSW